ncbi:MAG: porphobilinogen synthase [Bdellovibrionales bacterium]|nr:porphobilinogen synthase [Bdellovibrionales bacterium]
MSNSIVARPRRLRRSEAIRSLVRESSLSVSDCVYPLFIKEGHGIKKEISSMPGQYQLSIDMLEPELEDLKARGIGSVILFGIPSHKDAVGSENCNPKGVVPQAVRAIKEQCPDLVVISDMCFCEYTDHGHCGVVNKKHTSNFDASLPDGYLLNDQTLELLAKASRVHAEAGADIIAPSGMLDGMVGAIRQELDREGFQNTIILSYAVKYASSYYGPFREAAEGAPQFGDRSQYQMDPANATEALREVALDLEEGADMIMVKPALPYLDVIARVRDAYPHVPMSAYNVSGEFAMLHAAAEKGWLDLRKTALESLLAMKRAGANFIITYFAKDVADWLE